MQKDRDSVGRMCNTSLTDINHSSTSSVVLCPIKMWFYIDEQLTDRRRVCLSGRCTYVILLDSHCSLCWLVAAYCIRRPIRATAFAHVLFISSITWKHRLVYFVPSTRDHRVTPCGVLSQQSMVMARRWFEELSEMCLAFHQAALTDSGRRATKLRCIHL